MSQSLLTEVPFSHQQSHFQIPSEHNSVSDEQRQRPSTVEEHTLIRSLRKALQLNLKA